ncbi:hypothetical protein QN226_31625, partial [Sinorhizobium sp. 6-117]|nr:hypothetical protein [Sinorhizobium sp. 6-117]
MLFKLAQAGAAFGNRARQAAQLGDSFRLPEPERDCSVVLFQQRLEGARSDVIQPEPMLLPGKIAPQAQLTCGRVVHGPAERVERRKTRFVSGLAFAFVGNPGVETKSSLCLQRCFRPPGLD